jgi:type 1 fimbria pilin
MRAAARPRMLALDNFERGAQMPRRFAFVLIPVAALAVAFGGCGGRVIDKGKAKKAVEQQITARGVKKSQIKKVDCPGGVKPKKGKLYSCTATATDGSKLKVTFQMTDDKGGVTLKSMTEAK